jgi:hypothetical protein
MESWNLDLRASRKSDRTRETYWLAVTQLIDWLKNESRSMELGGITRDDLRGFLVWIREARSLPRPAPLAQERSVDWLVSRWSRTRSPKRRGCPR